MSNYKRLLILLLMAAMVLVACGGDETATVTEEVAPETVVEEAAPEEAAPVEEVAEAVEEATFDLAAAVDDYLSGIPEGFLSVKLEGFKELMATGEAVVIDVREVGEYEAGHVPGAINIPLRTLAQNLDKVAADKPVVVYCKSGHRAAMAVSALQIMGYQNARAYAASYKGWTAAEEPVSTEAVTAATYDVPAIEPQLLATVDEFLSGIPEGFLAMGDIEKLNEAIDNGAFLVDVRETKDTPKVTSLEPSTCQSAPWPRTWNRFQPINRFSFTANPATEPPFQRPLSKPLAIPMSGLSHPASMAGPLPASQWPWRSSIPKQ